MIIKIEDLNVVIDRLKAACGTDADIDPDYRDDDWHHNHGVRFAVALLENLIAKSSTSWNNELRLLKIRHLITQKEAAIAEANMQSARGGWLYDWSIQFNHFDNRIDAAIAESNPEGSVAARSPATTCWPGCNQRGTN